MLIRLYSYLERITREVYTNLNTNINLENNNVV